MNHPQRILCSLMVLSTHGFAGIVPVDLGCDGQSGTPATGKSPQLSWRIPEPSSFLLLGLSGAGLLARRRR